MAITTKTERVKSTEPRSPQPQAGIPDAPADPVPAEPAQPTKKKPFGLIIGAVVLIAAIFGYRTWSFNQTHASTDDAAVASSVVQISSQVSGTVAQVLVKDNEVVKKGELLAVLDDRPFVASVQQAQANVDAAVAQAQSAGVSVQLISQTGAAQVQQAQGVVGQAVGGISSAQAVVAQAQAGISTAEAARTTSIANVSGAKSAVDAAIAARSRAATGIDSAIAAVSTANAQVSGAKAAVATAQASEDFAAQEDDRYASLLAQGVASAQVAQGKASAHRAAQAQLDAAKQAVAAAEAQVQQRQSEVQAARDQLTAADAAVASARAQVRVAQSQSSATTAGIRQAEALRAAATQAVAEARAKQMQAQGQLSQANTASAQVAQSKSEQTAALAKVAQAKAALASAKLQLTYTRIIAPLDGRVSKKSIDVGIQIQPGTPLMGIVDEGNVWIVANFKETQMPGLDAGRPTDVQIDGLPGVTFKGRVESVSAGTGSTFALLPPDNASGNFTKVVQRIPVKVVLDPGQKDLDKLRVGMSAAATVSVK